MNISLNYLWSHKKFLSLLFFVVVLYGFFFHHHSPRDSALQTTQLRRGDLIVSVSATGTVEPEEVIDVGAQVAGQIVAFGKDRDGKSIDYGSFVEEGSLLAQIDTALYQADTQIAEAELKRANADLLQMQAKLLQAEQDWKRAQKLGPSDALSQSSYDGYRAAYEVAKATVAVGETAITQAQAGLEKAQRNLAFCAIKAPVSGVVIDRRVNIGQTVVSSLNAPSLFLLAKDLHKMELWVAVNEADIGKIHSGQRVTFNVDAYPNDTFEGTVGKIRLNATMSQNVVTYTVEVHTDNSDGKLLPYLTANAQFQVSDRHNVFLVPNAALRWTPQREQVSSKYRHEIFQSSGTRIWVVDDDTVRPISVKAEETDNTNTVIESDELKEGAEVVIGSGAENSAESASTTNTNPFAPQVFHRRGH